MKTWGNNPQNLFHSPESYIRKDSLCHTAEGKSVKNRIRHYSFGKTPKAQNTTNILTNKNKTKQKACNGNDENLGSRVLCPSSKKIPRNLVPTRVLWNLLQSWGKCGN